MGGVSNGQPVDESTDNGSFIYKNADDFTTNKLGLKRPGSGANVEDTQQAINDLIDSDDSQDSAISALQAKFHETDGHKHTGVSGDAPSLASSDDPLDVAQTAAAGSSKSLSAKDHKHRGVGSMQEFVEEEQVYGDIILKAGSNVSITRTGNTFLIESSATISGVPVGTTLDYAGLVAPSGWVLASGRTIGSAASGGTERANADTEDLFTLLWDNYTNDELHIQDSSGTPTTRGLTAAADFAADKRMPLPDCRGRIRAGKDDMGGTAANRLTSAKSGIDGTVLGKSGGEETHKLTGAESGTSAHGHTAPSSGTESGSHAHSTGGSDNKFVTLDGGDSALNIQVGGGQLYKTQYTSYQSASHTHPITVNNASAADASNEHQNTQPTIIFTAIMKL